MPDFARSGYTSTQTVVVSAGELEQFTHAMEPHLRKLGVPTVLNKGTVMCMAQTALLWLDVTGFSITSHILLYGGGERYFNFCANIVCLNVSIIDIQTQLKLLICKYAFTY